MEILKNFGFDPVMLAAQIVNFLIIFYLLKRFLYKPVLTTLKKREDEIKLGLKQAEEGKLILEEASLKETQILQKAQTDAQKIISDAKTQALELKESIEQSTKKEAQRMLDEARQTIEEQERATEEKLLKKVGAIATILLEKSLKGLFGEKEEKILIKKAIKEINKSDLL